jgi:hypothetical protein
LKSLFHPNFNWPVFVVVGLLIRVAFLDLSMLCFVVLMVSLYQFMLLFNGIGHVIPVRYLLGAFMCVQFFVGPALAYSGLDDYQYFLYKMEVPEMEYFGYAIPAVIAFIIGLHLYAGNLEGEVIDQKRVAAFVDRNPKLPYIFIGIGFVTSLVSSFFSSELAFVFYLLGGFKFIGLFMLVLGSKQLKLLPMVLVMGSIISSSLSEGMFHDLLTWTIFTGAVFAIKYKLGTNAKLIGAAAFVFIAVTIQLLKSNYRAAISKGDAGAESFASVYESQGANNGLFSAQKMAASNVRINQGFIITNIMITVPDKQPFEHGAEMMKIIESAIMPRFLDPGKLNAGDRDIVYKYSQIMLNPGTSMALSSLGDAYINFGVAGGAVFMFVLGLLYSWILNKFKKHSANYPVLILFTALSFYYPIRPDCELQTILGHLFKSVFLIYVVLTVWKRVFYMPAWLANKTKDAELKKKNLALAH